MGNNVPPGPADDVLPRADDVKSDGSLLRLFRHGDQHAATLLYLRYAARLRALAKSRASKTLAGRVDEDDILQSVFRSFFRGVIHGSYDVPAGEELWNLFLVITLNKVRSKGVYHRAAKRDVRKTVGDERLDRAAEMISTDDQAATLLRLAVDEALERLSGHHRQAVRLRMEGNEVAEIAEIMTRSKRSVERLLQESRARLGLLLDD